MKSVRGLDEKHSHDEYQWKVKITDTHTQKRNNRVVPPAARLAVVVYPFPTPLPKRSLHRWYTRHITIHLVLIVSFSWHLSNLHLSRGRWCVTVWHCIAASVESILLLYRQHFSMTLSDEWLGCSYSHTMKVSNIFCLSIDHKTLSTSVVDFADDDAEDIILQWLTECILLEFAPSEH